MSTSNVFDSQTHVPDFLQRRNFPANPSGSKGYLMDVEVIILTFLNDDGKLASKEKLEDFMAIIARMESLDQRTMAVEIIRHHTTEELYNLFVSYGGYRILKDWLVDSEKDRYLHFMIAVIKLCRILPFDKAAIKQSEIGKIIKKLTKFESKRQEQLDILRHELDMIMKEWRDKQQIASQLEKEQQQEFKLKEEQDTARKQEKEEIKVHEQLQQQKQSIKIEKKLTHTVVNESKEDDNRIDVVEEVKPKVEPKRVLSSGSHSRPTPVAISTPVVPTKVPTKSTPLLTALLQNQQSLQQPNAFTSGAAAISAKSNKRTIDMLQGAHELLNQSANRSASPSEPVLAKIDLTVKPLAKGGLKKRDDGSKKEKKSIRWADDEGGSLREVQTIEVERIKSTVANYKSHKDLVKRERQFEKETHLSKTSEAMHATTSWRIPKPLTLTIDIIDNIGLPENCTEIATQNKRLSILMETKYLDESLIPSDPDRSLADQDALNNGGPGKPSVIIPWLMNDEVDEDAALIASLQQQHTVPSSSSVSSGYGSRDLSLPHAAHTAHTAAHTIDYSMQIAQLPRMIQMLDPMTLQMVLDNDVVLQSLVRHDGSVNEEYLDILQNSSSLDDYLQALSFVSEPSFSNFGHGWQNNNVNPMSIPNHLHHQPQLTANNGLMFNNALPLSNNFNNNSVWPMNNLPSNMPNGMPNSNLANILNNLNNIANNNASMSMNMSNMQSMNMNMNPNNTSSFSIPSMGLDLSTIDGARLSKPISSKSSTLSTRATIACKFFNTARGCANGDKCPFGHFRQNPTSSAAPMSNSMTATIVSNLMSDGGSQKRGPGNTRGGRGPGQKGGRGGFRHG